MLDFAKQLFGELYWKLSALDEADEAFGLSPENRAPMINAAIDELSEQLRTHVFENEAEEAEFFKTGLPPLLALASYYLLKYDIGLLRHYGAPASMKRRLVILIEEMKVFFGEHADFAHYCLSGKTDLDAYYFLRSSPANEKTIDLLTILVDPEISTVHSVRAATVIAYIWLMRDLHNSIFGNPYRERLPRKPGALRWTDPSTGLVEVIYAFYAKGSFNNGNATLKDIAEYFEDVFSVNLGNFYRTYQEILCRKNGITRYLSKLTRGLEGFVRED
jgi:hypothetical protein